MVIEELFADLVLRNGKIVTVDPRDAVAQAVAVKGNRIVVVGGDEDVSGLISSFGDGVHVTLGPLRSQEHAFPLRSMLEEGMHLVSGSDGPNLEPAAPLRDMGTAILRKTDRGIAVNPSEAIPVMEALRMFTINAAYLEFEEGVKGSIEAGKLADLVVLSEDPLTVAPERLREIKVDATIIDGKIAYMRT